MHGDRYSEGTEWKVRHRCYQMWSNIKKKIANTILNMIGVLSFDKVISVYFLVFGMINNSINAYWQFWVLSTEKI